MCGIRWNSVKKDYRSCLNELAKMKDILVTTITFDENVNLHGKLKKPSEALKTANKIPCSKGETNYPKALSAVIKCIEEAILKHENYCTCILFLSDGQGGYPEKEIEKIVEMKNAGQKIIFYTIAFMAEEGEDDDMIKMITVVGGEHFKITSQKTGKEVFAQILGI